MTFEELLAENRLLRERIIELEQENARLKAQYAPVLSEPESPRYGTTVRKTLTEEEKEVELQRRIAIFSNLFKGREDVFAQRFVSKSGKQGYQPVCRNRWSTVCQEHKSNVKDALLESLSHWMIPPFESISPVLIN